MRPFRKAFRCVLSASGLLFILAGGSLGLAQESFPFKGQVNDDFVNIRSDSTTGAPVICVVKKGSRMDVVSEIYDWYKVRLPAQAPAFIKKPLVECIDSTKVSEPFGLDSDTKAFNRCQTAKVTKERVNIRLAPSESSAILGKADQNEIVRIVSETQDWYKIEPIQNSFGWVHKKFIVKAPAEERLKSAQIAKEEVEKAENVVVIEGTIKPHGKIFKQVATHKLMAQDNRVFLLKGDKKSLDALNGHKAKITGKIISNPSQKYPTVEVKILEVVD